jgi:hypothetical protein
MKIIKLFVIHMLLLSSFQTLAFSVIATEDNSSTPKDNFSTPGIAKVINLKSSKSSSLLEFAIVPGLLDSKKFTLKGDGRNLEPYTLTFEATDFNKSRDGSIPGKNIYQVKVRASLTTSIGNEDIFTETADKIITVTVEELRITTADISVPENTLPTSIRLTTNKDATKNVIFSINSVDNDRFVLSAFDNDRLSFETTDFEARENNIYSVTITARTGKGDEAEVATKTITVTVTDLDEYQYLDR